MTSFRYLTRYFSVRLYIIDTDFIDSEVDFTQFLLTVTPRLKNIRSYKDHNLSVHIDFFVRLLSIIMHCNLYANQHSFTFYIKLFKTPDPEP